MYIGSSCGELCGQWSLHILEEGKDGRKAAPGVTCITVSESTKKTFEGMPKTFPNSLAANVDRSVGAGHNGSNAQICGTDAVIITSGCRSERYEPLPAIAVPASTFAPPLLTSTKLNICSSGATWILKFHPQPDPQLRFAVPEPLAFNEVIVKV